MERGRAAAISAHGLRARKGVTALLVQGAALACLVLSGSVQAAGSAQMPRAAGQLYRVGAAQLYVQISGSGAPVLFLHGGLSFFDVSFAAQRDYFGAFRTVIGIDQRGHGHSPDNGQAFSYRQMAEDTAAVLQQLKLGPVDVVGHSDGGNVALLLARLHPEQVRRVVVSGANTRGDPGGLLAYARFWMETDQHFTQALAPDLRQAYARVSPDGVDHWPIFAAKTKDLWLTWTVLDADDLAAIRAPVLVMAGEHDVISLEHTRYIARHLAHGRLCILPGSGHMTMRERPEEFNRVVRAFLDEAPAGP